MWRISKTFQFAAAHFLPRVHAKHKCGSMHGHTYSVTFVFQSDELVEGMVHDFELKDISEWVAGVLDHKNLNNILTNPTSECLARYVFDTWAYAYPTLSCVRVSESPNTFAEWCRDA